MGIKDKINQFIAYKKISKNAFEKSIGVSKSYLSNTSNISADVLLTICRVYSEISAEWLLKDRGNMIDIVDETVPNDTTSYTDTNLMPLLDVIKRQNININNLEKEIDRLRSIYEPEEKKSAV